MCCEVHMFLMISWFNMLHKLHFTCTKSTVLMQNIRYCVPRDLQLPACPCHGFLMATKICLPDRSTVPATMLGLPRDLSFRTFPGSIHCCTNCQIFYQLETASLDIHDGTSVVHSQQFSFKCTRTHNVLSCGDTITHSLSRAKRTKLPMVSRCYFAHAYCVAVCNVLLLQVTKCLLHTQELILGHQYLSPNLVSGFLEFYK